MRKKVFLSLLPFFFLSVSSYAGTIPNGLLMDSADPWTDSLFFNRIRRHLDSVRLAAGRPTVALVLCGGGAKGAAEIGALSVLEELGIPIDFVCGTSIGSLVGGLYAVGYDAVFLDSLIRNQDWAKTLSDRIDRRVVPLRTKRKRTSYQLMMPFHYARETMQERVLGQEKYSDSDGHLHVSDAKHDLDTRLGVNSIVSSLPSGYVYGLNVNNLFSSLTAGYQDSLSFVDLPIPFCCVATDMVSCKEKNWGSGQLKTAMRSSMSIPGLFCPVRTEGMVLVDGGTRNNFPADLARAAGADIVIGIDIENPYATYPDVTHAGTLVSQFINMMSRDSYEAAVKLVDICIKPDLKGYTSLSFSREAIDTLIVSGRRAALARYDDLVALKKSLRNGKQPSGRRKAVNLNEHKVRISAVIFDGMSDAESDILQNRIKLDVSQPVDAAMLENAVAVIQATGAVESVTYSLLGSEEPFRLVFNCSKAPTHQIGVGLRLDTEIWAEVGLHLGLNTKRLSGPKLEIDGKLGVSQALSARFMLDYPHLPTLNLSAQVANCNCDIRPFVLNGMKLSADYWSHREKIFVSSVIWTRFEGQAGLCNTFRALHSNRVHEDLTERQRKGDYLGAFVRGSYYTLDNHWFPTRGLDLDIGADVDFLKFGVKAFRPVYTINCDARFAIPCGSLVCLVPDIHLRGVFDEANVAAEGGDTYSYGHRNFIGGEVSGRYISGQIPFIGFNGVSDCIMYGSDSNDGIDLAYDHVAVLNLDLRVNVYRKLYLSAQGGVAHMANTFSGLFTFRDKKDIFGAALQLGYDSFLGPIKAKVQWSNRFESQRYNWGAYLSLGVEF